MQLTPKYNYKYIFQVIFAKGNHYAVEDLMKCGYDVLQIDWTMDPLATRTRVGPDVTIQVHRHCSLYYDINILYYLFLFVFLNYLLYV